MKNFKCPTCAREKQSNAVMVICFVCQKQMKLFPLRKKEEVII